VKQTDVAISQSQLVKSPNCVHLLRVVQLILVAQAIEFRILLGSVVWPIEVWIMAALSASNEGQPEGESDSRVNLVAKFERAFTDALEEDGIGQLITTKLAEIDLKIKHLFGMNDKDLEFSPFDDPYPHLLGVLRRYMWSQKHIKKRPGISNIK